MSKNPLEKVSEKDLELILQGKVEQVSEEGLDNYLAAESALISGPPEPEKTGVLDVLDKKAQALQGRGWNNLSRTERLELMAAKFPEKFLEVGLGVVKGAPAMTMRAAPPIIGQKIGEMSRVPALPYVLGAGFGAGGEIAASLYEGSELTLGKVAEAAMAGAIKGRGGRGNSMRQRTENAARESFRQGAENVAIDTAGTAIDTGELKAPSAEAFAGGQLAGGASGLIDSGSRARNERVRAADERPAYRTTSAAYDAGEGRAKGAAFPISPRTAIPTPFEKAVNSAVRRDVGLPETAQLNTGTLDVHLNRLYEPYRRAAAISPQLQDTLNAVTESRAEARRLHKAYRASQGNRPDLLDQADEYDEIARQFETELVNGVRAAGNHELAEQIIANRRLAAKTHLAMRANNSARGMIDADEYGRTSRKNPRLLDGDAKLIADTFNARQQQDFQLGTMLSRPVMIAEKGAGLMSTTRAGQYFARNVPSFHEYPDLKSATASLLLKQWGRDESKQNVGTAKERLVKASEGVKEYIGAKSNP